MKQFLMIGLLIGVSASGQAQSVRTLVTPDSAAVGQTISFSILSSYDPDSYQPVYPDSTFFADPFEFRSMQVFRGVQARDSVVYRLQFFGTSDTLIAEKPIQFRSSTQALVTVRSAAVPVYFRSNLTADVGELRPIKPIFDFARNWWPLLVVLLGVIAAAALLWRYRDRLRPRTALPVIMEPPPDFVNPLHVLDEELQELSNLHRYESDAFKEFYFRLSIALRRYYENTYQVPALESTTREVVDLLRRQDLVPEILEIVNSVLRESDLVKFAKVIPSLHDAEQILQKVFALKELARKIDQRRIQQLRAAYEIRVGLRKPDPLPLEPDGARQPLITPKPDDL